ncbi:hypothetical protein MUU72_04655 [Streptomyces sp. RS10V-4]|uniref:DUF7224 domain-containing protein n=1 Tax=Streptomyces rhizoryzae TaxID=2932493 RepID=UPI0020065CCD|nr:hypothetical protein [Streptomyces rhizoryzae]MCK7622413.1 hypothetical protein [Streptomyces rhizoryzae]
MPWRTVLRTSAATWLAPFLVAFVVLLLSDEITAQTVPGYWPSAMGSASSALHFTAPACATAGAWEGARCTRGGVAHRAPARSGLGVALPLLVPVLALGALGMAVALAVALSAGLPGAGTPPLGMVPVWLGVLAAHSLAGFLLGRRLPRVLSAPLALVISFVVAAYPAAMEPLWMRHMVDGGMSSCCSLSQTPGWRAAASAFVLTLGVITAAAVALTALTRRVRTCLVCTAVAAGLAGSGGLAYGLPADPVTARPTDALVCAGEAPRVCLWPEAERPAMVREHAADAQHRLHQAGLPVPAELTMAERPGRGSAVLGSGKHLTPYGVRAAVGAALLPTGPPACADNRQPPATAPYAAMAVWLALTAGADPQEAESHYGPEAAAVADRVRRAARSDQLAWFTQNRRALTDCTTRPAPPPAPRGQEAAR